MPNQVSVVTSSPVRGLEEYRKGAINAVVRMGMDPVVMERLVTDGKTPLEASLDLIDKAEIYVGLLGFRYGDVPEGEELSFTELEYLHAKSRGIRTLIFLMDNKLLQVGGTEVDQGEKWDKLVSFRKRLQKERVIGEFINPDALRADVLEALVPHRREDTRKLHGSRPIPNLPEAFIAHPYTLLDHSRVVGRQKEVSQLTDWIANPTSDLYSIRTLSVVAIGGMGKSALTWKWFREVVPNEMRDLDGSVWWSFYESDASFEVFVTRVLAYLTGRDLAGLEEEPMQDRVELLLGLLDEGRFLLVLDGLERLLNAYSRLDASRMEDADLDRQTNHGVKNPIGTPWNDKEAIGKHYLRMASDSYAQTFLRRLGGIRNSRILVTTRLFPADQQETSGETVPGTRALFLSGLEPSDALDL